MLYAFYRIGSFISAITPRSLTIGLAHVVAYLYWRFSRKDREMIERNIRVVKGNNASKEEIDRITHNIFLNFARYLELFFRFSAVDKAFIRRHVLIEGEEYLNIARSHGKGTILLAAHIGNWELGGAAIALLGYPLSVVALTHKDRRVNDFFLKQRSLSNVNVIPLGPGVKKCFTTLKEGKFLALLGDRIFSKHGEKITFCGKPAYMPTGPAAISSRTGAPIVPTFMLLGPGLNFRLIFEKPIFPDSKEPHHIETKRLMHEYFTVLESYITRFPDQWMMFTDVWNEK